MTLYSTLFQAVQGHTMIPEERFIENLRCVEWLRKQSDFPDGTIVECGVWRGGMAVSFMKLFGPTRIYRLFDSFDGLPPPSNNDGEDAMWWHSHPEHPRFYNNCKAAREDVETLISRVLAPGFQVEIHKGWFSDSLFIADAQPIAFLHLDCDWYDSIMQCLTILWPAILPGGGIIIDDYYDWEGCRRAVHDFLSRHRAREAIERVGVSGGAFIRRRGPWQLSESPHLW